LSFRELYEKRQKEVKKVEEEKEERKRERRPKAERHFSEPGFKHDFIAWIESLDEKEYVEYSGIIKRIKKWKRPSFIKDVLDLLDLYLKKNNAGGK
jgi:uncharacterized protein Yka (UPF0111/DUF47 family)